MEQDQLNLIRRIASVVGHELRNPLAVINNSAYFLKTKLGQDGRLDPKVEKHLGIVVSEIGRVDGMIADILTYSRPLAVKGSPLPSNALVEAKLAATALPDKITLKKNLAKDAGDVKGDEKLLADALRRLLDNAIEAMGEGGTLTVSTRGEKKSVVVEVSDTGPGLKPEAGPLLFQPFGTTKPRGLGLGLAMAKKIAEAHGGKAEGGAGAKGGCAFRLVLPAV
jgi:signal transduction histidine kinase